MMTKEELEGLIKEYLVLLLKDLLQYRKVTLDGKIGQVEVRILI